VNKNRNVIFSIITVVYNADKTIANCLQSVDQQSLKDIEHIVIDGGSTDQTLDILSKNSASHRTVISQSDNGIYDAMNKGLAMAKGTFVAILNADDVFQHSESLKIVQDTFVENSADIVIGSVEYFRFPQITQTVRRWRVLASEVRRFSTGWHPPHPGFFVRRKCYELGGDFDVNLRVSADFDLMLRFIDVLCFKVEVLESVTTRMAVDGMSGAWRNRIIGNVNVIRAFRKYNVRINPFIYLFRRLYPKMLGLLGLK